MKWTGALILVSMMTCVLGLSSFLQQQAIAGLNNFTFEIYRQVSTQPKNIILSGFSAALAMGMLEAGAEYQTRQQVITALGLQNFRESQILKVFRHIMRDANFQNGNTTLTLANGMFIQQNYAVSDTYERRLIRDFSAQVRMEDFVNNGNQAVKDINAWVSKQTNGLISTLFANPLPTNTILLLLNTVYFLGKWQSPFNQSDTAPAPFYGPDGQVTVQMMHINQAFKAGEDANLRLNIVVLNYSDNHTRMVLLVPKDRLANLSSIEQQLNYNVFNRLLSETSMRQVVLSMPKFNLTWSSSLEPALQALGVRRVFTDKAQLGGISSGAQLKVSDVYQEAVVKVDEEGTEAAASTGVVIVPTLVRFPLVITADHPFIFVIQNETSGQIFFMGRANQP